MTIESRREMLQGRRAPLDRFVDRSDPLNRLMLQCRHYELQDAMRNIRMHVCALYCGECPIVC
jgi:hypothetical protein